MSVSRLRRHLREALAELRVLFRKSEAADSEEERRALFSALRKRLEEHARAMQAACADPEFRAAAGAYRVAESAAGNRLLTQLVCEMAAQDPRSAEFQASLALLRRNAEILFEEVEEPLMSEAEKQFPDEAVDRLSRKLREPAQGTLEAPPKNSRPHRRPRAAMIALAVLAALPVFLVLAFLVGLNPIVRKGAETLAQSALKVPVAVDHARVNIAGGVHLTRVALGNPREFKEVRAFRLDRLDAAVALPSLFGRTVEIQELLLINPEITVEFNQSKTNWGAIFDNLAAAAAGPPSADAKKFIIHRIRILHPVVIVRSSMVPKGAAIHLRDIELKDVGTAEGSASPTYLVLATIFQALISGAISEWSGVPGELSGILGEDVSRGAKAFEGTIVQPEK